MSPDLIPNKSSKVQPFLVCALLFILDHFCTALLAAVQYGTLVPHLSPWLFLAMLPFCAPKSVWGLCAYPLLPVPWKRFYRFVGIHDGYFRDNTLARGGVGDSMPIIKR